MGSLVGTSATEAVENFPSREWPSVTSGFKNVYAKVVKIAHFSALDKGDDGTKNKMY